MRPKCRARVSPGNSDRPGLQFRPFPPLAAGLAAHVRGLRPGAPRPADPAQGWFSLQQSPGDGAKNADSLDSLSRPHNSDCAFPEQDPEVLQFFAGGPGDFDAGDGCSLRSRVLICYRLRPAFLLPYRSDLYLLFPRQCAFAIAKTIFEPSFSGLYCLSICLTTAGLELPTGIPGAVASGRKGDIALSFFPGIWLHFQKLG